MDDINPQYPIFIVSHRRWDICKTANALTRMDVPFTMIVEEDEAERYKEAMPGVEVLAVPKEYHDNYENCDNLGRTKSQGPGPARNYAWDLSVERGFASHWVMDDNISRFFRVNNNIFAEVADGLCFRIIEDFVDRYRNIAMSGPNYNKFLPMRHKHPPAILNTRIYSCNLIRNDIPYRWRGRYNEDTDLSLRILKDGWATVQFNFFVQEKATTQTMRGGNNEEFYKKEGTLPKSQMLVMLHPDTVKLVYRYHRWHHQINYNQFKGNKLLLKEGLEGKIPSGSNDYGMRLFAIADPITGKPYGEKRDVTNVSMNDLIARHLEGNKSKP